MILEYAHHLAERYGEGDPTRVEVRATARAGLNGRPFEPLVDPTVDLARERRGFARYAWIEPMDEPLPEVSVQY